MKLCLTDVIYNLHRECDYARDDRLENRVTVHTPTRRQRDIWFICGSDATTGATRDKNVTFLEKYRVAHRARFRVGVFCALSECTAQTHKLVQELYIYFILLKFLVCSRLCARTHCFVSWRSSREGFPPHSELISAAIFTWFCFIIWYFVLLSNDLSVLIQEKHMNKLMSEM